MSKVNWWDVRKWKTEDKIGYSIVIVLVLFVVAYAIGIKLYSESSREGCEQSCMSRVSGHITSCYFEERTIISKYVPEDYTLLKCNYVFNETIGVKLFYINEYSMEEMT